MPLKLGTYGLRSYVRLICEYELHIALNTKVIAAKIDGKTT